MTRITFCVLCAAVLVAGTAWGEHVLEVRKDPEKGAMFGRVGSIVNGNLDWGVASRIAKASSMDVGYDGGEIAVLVYTDDEEKTEIYCRVGSVDKESLTVSWGESEKASFKGRNPTVTIKGNKVICALRGSSKDNLYVVTGTIMTERKQVAWGSPQSLGTQGTKIAID